jgi:predicted HNH restriction endonuclease
MAPYLSYWKPGNIDWDNPSRELLDHTAGNQLKKISRGDRLYLMTYREGEYYLLGRILADAIVSQAQAARRLGRRPNELWEADYHVLAAPPIMRAVAIPFTQTLQNLQLASGRTVGRLRGPNSVQGFRVLREIAPDSAAALDTLIRDLTATDVSVPDLDIHPEERMSVEGQLALRIHLARERDPRIVAQKKRAAASLACEACGFLFRARYGTVAADYCEIHHLLPLAQSDSGHATRLDDLAILCANCHRVSHLRTPPFTVDEIRAMLQSA